MTFSGMVKGGAVEASENCKTGFTALKFNSEYERQRSPSAEISKMDQDTDPKMKYQFMLRKNT